jgi:hypothetical protein
MSANGDTLLFSCYSDRMPELSSELKQKGQAAELAFRQWVERSGISHLYVEQSPFSVPANLKDKIKRPDFLLGFPTIGAVAFDVKAKQVYNGLLLFDDYERFALANFERLFHIAVWYACFTDDLFGVCHLFLNEMLLSKPTIIRSGKNCCAIEIGNTVALDVRTHDFAKSFLETITL